MTEYKTMRVPAAAWEAAQEARGENETWGEYLQRCADEPMLHMTEADVEHIAARKIREMVVDDALF